MATRLLADGDAFGRGGAQAPSSLSKGESSAPLHVQLADIMREMIYAREWGDGAKVPSEHALMERFGIARGTVRRAIKLLVDEGLLVSERGKGTFVAGSGIEHAVGTRPFSFAEALEREGIAFTTRVADLWVTPAPSDVARALELEPFTEVLYVQRVRSTPDGEPIMCQESWLSLAECPGLQDIDFTSESLFNAVQRCAGRRVKYSHMRYSARIAGREHAELLGCDESAAVLMLEQVICLADKRPVEWSIAWFTPGQAVVSTAVQSD